MPRTIITIVLKYFSKYQDQSAKKMNYTRHVKCFFRELKRMITKKMLQEIIIWL